MSYLKRGKLYKYTLFQNVLNHNYFFQFQLLQKPPGIR
jgi:hypothetical protein